MAEVVLIYGASGSGKSRSMKNFKDDEVFLVNTIDKRLPFKSNFKYVGKSDNVDTIIGALQKMPTKVAVIDDAGYLMTNKFMKGHANIAKGASTFDLYNDIADSFWKLIQAAKALPEDVIVYIMMHEETNDYGDTKLRTIGKLLNDKVCIEGMCTIVLRCMSEDGRHYFRTQTDGRDITKAPEDMFKEVEIENDLKAVDTTIREFYGMTTKKGEK